MPRRTADQQIADLEAKIQALKAKAAAAKVKKDPALKFVSKALRLIDSASGATKDQALRKALEEARSTLAACMQLKGVTLTPRGSAPKRAPRVGTIDRETLLTYVRNNPGSRGEQIAAALGTDTTTMRPVMKALIAERKVKTAGERRGMAYTAV
mgnify:CR=1 FL=1